MCGIIGYTGQDECSDIILQGLKTLEYRGYDSWGITIKGQDGLSFVKEVGEIEGVSKINLKDGTLGMGHTRWSTHGGVTKLNSHPHFSQNGEIAVVHNGIVENHQDLKKFLTEKGFTFKTETDTEVIPNLIEYYCKDNDFFLAVRKSLERLEGDYAVVIASNKSDKLYAARRGSPLVLGIGNTGNFIASDVPAFLEHTRKVVYLYDRDIAEVDKKEFRIFNLNKRNFVTRPIDDINWGLEEAKKGEFKHFMLKEISEQTRTIELAAKQDPELLDKACSMIRNASKVVMVACGSSYHAALSAKYNFAHIANINVSVVAASELPHFDQFIDDSTTIIAISQSGETADVLDAVKVAKNKNANIISLTNVLGSSLMRVSDCTLLLNAGPEIGVLSTKTQTAQQVILNLLAYNLSGSLESGKKILNELVRHIYYLTSANARTTIKKLASQLRYTNHMFLIGRGMQYPTAMEAALKIKEVSYIHAEGFAGGELKHGVIALIEHGTPCIVFVPKNDSGKILSNASELKSRGAYIIGVAEENNNLFDFFVKVRDAGELNSICQLIPMQILAYQLAILKGCNPDKPRNLAKSVTVK